MKDGGKGHAYGDAFGKRRGNESRVVFAEAQGVQEFPCLVSYAFL